MKPGYRAGIDESRLADMRPEIPFQFITGMSLDRWQILRRDVMPQEGDELVDTSEIRDGSELLWYPSANWRDKKPQAEDCLYRRPRE